MKKFLIILTLLMVAIVSGYIAGSQYYTDRFHPNTSLASVDISNLTTAEAKHKISQSISEYEIHFKEDNQAWQPLPIKIFEADIKPEGKLSAILQEQQNQNWLQAFFNKDETLIDNQDYISINRDTVAYEISQLDEKNNITRSKSTNAQIAYTNGVGYKVEAEVLGNEIDYSILTDAMINAAQTGTQTVDVSEAYIQPTITSSDSQITSVIEQIESVTSMEITLLIAGFEEIINHELISSWIIIDENQEISFDENLIYEYLGTLNEQYATFDDYRLFNSTMQGEVELLPGTLGWSIDREAETQSILDDLYAGISIEREPAIVGSGYNGTLDDITNSYIEVDMTNQMMFVYIDGEIAISTPIVTGQIGTNTIPGAYVVWNMETPSELIGYNPRTDSEYVQPVQYWIAFDDTGQGVHDADWQPAFGGDIYLTSGSLGCINTPPDIMPLVFEYAYLGMPVLVFQ